MAKTGPARGTKNFNQKGFTKNFLAFMKVQEQQIECCTNFLTTDDFVITGANDGLSMSGNFAVLGGVVLIDKILDFATNDTDIWFKGPLNPTTAKKPHTVIIGSTNNSQWENYDSSLLISRNSNDNNNNAVMLSMVCGDVSGINGWQFLNYQDGAGEILPNLRVASNAPAGVSAAFNVDMIGRDSRNDFSHFSMWYYDYDDYIIRHNNAGPMTNSNFINFTNGSGGDPTTCVNFFFVDKFYNFMIGKHAFSYRPAGNLDIGDNGSTYSIYQQGAGSVNWLAGKTVVGGSPTTTLSAWITPAASNVTTALFNLPVGPPPTNPVDGDLWRQDNTNTGVKIRVAGITKTLTLS